jgi:hypothetical protein
LSMERLLGRTGTEKSLKINFWPVSTECGARSALLPDSTVSGGFWEERNAKAKVKVNVKVNKTIKFHVEWSVSKSS